MGQGVFSTERMVEAVDEVSGEKIYQKFYEDESGTPRREFLLESEYKALSPEEQQSCRQYFEYSGQPMEGMIRTMWQFGRSLATMDQDKLKELWNDPYKRALFKTAIWDEFLLGLIGMFITFCFGSGLDVDKPLNASKVYQACKDVGPSMQYMYNVLTGSQQDATIQGIIYNMTQIPASISSAKRLYKSSIDVFTGKNNPLQLITKNFGAARDFDPVIADLFK